MSCYDSNPFDVEEVNPFADQGAREKRGRSKYGGSRFYTINPGSVPPATSTLTPLPPEPYDRGATIDIPLDNAKELKAKEKELQTKIAELKKKEQVVDVVPRIDRYLARDYYLDQQRHGRDILLHRLCVFLPQVAPSIWVLQQVYMYFRGSGKAAEMKRDACKENRDVDILTPSDFTN